MRVAFFPNNWHTNPYLSLLEAALRDEGISVMQEVPSAPYVSWLKDNQGNVDVLHFHWPESIYQRKKRVQACRAVLAFFVELVQARRWGFRIVWTMHNTYSHERRYPLLDYVVWQMLAWLAHRVIVHCKDAGDKLRRRFLRSRGADVAYLGNYIDVYGPLLSRSIARKRLGVNQKERLFLHLGQIRPYKGVETLLAAFAQVGSDEVKLIIGGQPKPPSYADRILCLASEDERVVCHLRWLEDEEVRCLLGGCDTVVLPFSQVQTSSTVVLAMSYGKPVIVPSIGCLPELVSADTGITYNPESEDGLINALRQALIIDLESFGRRALERAKTWRWKDVGSVTSAAYRGKNVCEQ